jgi:hypothetical protein
VIQDILHVDRDQIWVEEGLGVVAAIIVASLFEVLFGEVARYAMVAAFFMALPDLMWLTSLRRADTVTRRTTPIKIGG